jgi:glycosyltransferase involved in cell wall biosynthesis
MSPVSELGRPSWSIIVFGFDEAPNLPGTLESTYQVGQELKPDAFEIVMVDDGSTYGSSEVIAQYARQWPNLKTFRHERNRGIGQALRTGYASCGNELVCAVPADGQFDLHTLLRYPHPKANQFVSFYRSSRPTYSLFRHAVSGVNRWLMRGLFGVNLNDVNWVKIYRREDILRCDLRLTSSLVESELCAKLIFRGVECTQHPSAYLGREHGVARGASLKTIARAVKELFRLILVMRRFQRTETRSSVDRAT